MPSFIDRTGKRYGKLTAVSRLPNKDGYVMWECVCDCGNKTTVPSSSLSSNTTSCGCAQREKTISRCTEHGMSRTSEHKIWLSMIDRCTNPKSTSWGRYGGRGIGVHEDWKNSFLSFYRDMGPRPSKIHSLERVKNDGNYEPGNVVWATMKEQNRNKRNNRLITYGDVTLPMCAWAEKVGITYGALRLRLNSGWSVERALSEPQKK